MKPEMTQELERRLNVVRRDVIDAHYYWQLHSQLIDNWLKYHAEIETFGRDLFTAIRVAIVDKTILSLARTVDPPRVSGKSTVSFGAIVKKWLADEAWSTKVDALVVDLKQIREYRHNFLAHRGDEAHFEIDEKVTPLLSGEVDGCIRACARFINELDEHFGRPPWQYSDVITRGNWQAVFEGLRRGHQFRLLQTHIRATQRVSIIDVLGPERSKDASEEV